MGIHALHCKVQARHPLQRHVATQMEVLHIGCLRATYASERRRVAFTCFMCDHLYAIVSFHIGCCFGIAWND